MRRYVAHHTLVVVRERAVSSVTTTAGTLWRGVRTRRQQRNYVVQVRDNYLSVVFINLGGGGRDAVAVVVIAGAVAVATIHVQCGIGLPGQNTRKADRQAQLPHV